MLKKDPPNFHMQLWVQLLPHLEGSHMMLYKLHDDPSNEHMKSSMDTLMPNHGRHLEDNGFAIISTEFLCNGIAKKSEIQCLPGYKAFLHEHWDPF